MKSFSKIQDRLNSIPFNFEKKGETLKSPMETLKQNSAHCFEGALLAAYLLSLQGFKPLIMYLKATKDDFDHVIAPFKYKGYWGAFSKTNHAVLCYREPIYKTIRELAMSYSHEYFLDNGKKTLRYYSEPLDLNIFEDWIGSDGDLWGIDEELNKVKHYMIVPKHMIKKLRLADDLEIKAGKITS